MNSLYQTSGMFAPIKQNFGMKHPTLHDIALSIWTTLAQVSEHV